MIKLKNRMLIPWAFSFDSIFSILISVVFCSINQSWQFNPYGWVDHWAYLGHSEFLTTLRSAFPTDPSGDLLPVIWPSHILNSIVPNHSQAYIRAFLYLFISVFLIIKILRTNYSRNLAYLIASIWVGSQYVLTSLGANYPTGSVIIYILASIYYLQKKYISQTERYINAGKATIFLSLSFYSAILTIIYIPAILVFYFVSCKAQGDKLSFRSKLYTLTLALALFCTTTLVLQGIYSIYGSGFFFENNIQKLLGFTVGNAYRAPAFSTWLPYATWLALPIIITITQGYLYILYRRSKRDDVVFNSFLALTTITLIAQVFVNVFGGQWSMQFMYFNQTLGIYLLALGPLLSRILASTSNRNQIFLICVALSLSVLSLFEANQTHFTSEYLIRLVHPLEASLNHPLRGLAFLLLITPFILTYLVFREKLLIFVLLIFMTVNIFSVSPTFGCFACFNAVCRAGNVPGLQSASENQLLTLQLVREIDRIDRKRKFKLWFNELEPLGPVFRQVNAVGYLNSSYNRVSKSFPDLEETAQPIGSEGSGFSDGIRLLIITTNLEKLNDAFETLKNNSYTVKHLQIETKTQIGNFDVFLITLQLLST